MCVCDDGDSMPIGRHSESKQFFFTLSCGVHHHMCTPKAVTSEKRLLCSWCEPPARLKAAGVRRPTEPERDMHASLGDFGVCEVWVREARLPWWHGQLDFWFPTRGLALQVDGPHHFLLQPRTPHERQQATIDCSMCEAAWRAGCGVVRVHHLHASTKAAAVDVSFALHLRALHPAAPLLILGAGFQPEACGAMAGRRDAAAFLTALQDALKTPPLELPSGSILFSPSPPHPQTSM